MEMTNNQFKIFFVKSLLLAAVVSPAGGYSQTVFTNNNSVTNKLLSVETFLNNGKFHIDTENETEYNFFGLKKFVNAGLFRFNQNIVIENSQTIEEGELTSKVIPLEVFDNQVGGVVVANKTEEEFGYFAISANEISNQYLVTYARPVGLIPPEEVEVKVTRRRHRVRSTPSRPIRLR